LQPTPIPPPLPELNAWPAATNQHGSRNAGGEEALQTPDKKGPLTNTNNINYKYFKGNKYNTYTHLYNQTQYNQNTVPMVTYTGT